MKKKRDKKLEIRLFAEELAEIRRRYGRAAAEVARKLLCSGVSPRARRSMTAEERMEGLRVLAAMWVDYITFCELVHDISGGDPDVAAAKTQFQEHFNSMVEIWCCAYSGPDKEE